MKIALIFSLFAVALASSRLRIAIKERNDDSITIESQADSTIFDKFLTDFSIDLKPTDSYEERLGIFMENYRKILNHNERFRQGLESFSMGVNQFTHLTVEEMMSLSGDEVDDFNFDNSTETDELDDIALPRSFSWLNQNVLQPVQSQGHCGSCYVFASIAAIEAQMMIHFRSSVKLSEQEAMECLNGCHGGSRAQVLRFSHNHNGCAPGRLYPYKARPVHACPRNLPRVRHSKVTRIQVLHHERQMMRMLVQYGPISAGILTYESLHYYSGGVYRKLKNEPRRGAHAILIVGYGEDRRGGKYWLIRNSWGHRWGEKGYFRMARGENMCHIESRTSFIPHVH